MNYGWPTFKDCDKLDTVTVPNGSTESGFVSELIKNGVKAKAIREAI